MTTKNALVTTDKEELRELGHEIKTLLPGGANLTDNQAIALAKYAQLTDGNPFRGEIYGYQDWRGELNLVDGYKQLVRWAERVSPFDQNYFVLAEGEEGMKGGDIGYRCVIMRHDKKDQIREYISMGATFTEAYELVSSSAVGVVLANEMVSRKTGKAIDAPTGWTWDQVAKKRALKNALNLAFPMPSVSELAAGFETEGVTQADWQYAAQFDDPEIRERAAKLNAQERERAAARAEMTPEEITAQAEQNIDLLRGLDDFEDVIYEDEPDEHYPDEPGQWLPGKAEFIEQVERDFKQNFKKSLWPILRDADFGPFNPINAQAMYAALAAHFAAQELPEGDK